MTAYIVSGSATATSTTPSVSVVLGVMPSSTFPIRISKLEVCGNATGSSGVISVSYLASVYPSSLVSGGSAITPFALRRDALVSATATAKLGGSISGTNVLLHGENQVVYGPNAFASTSMNSNYQFPFDLILASGSTLVLSAAASSTSTVSVTAALSSVAIYFEELRENWAS